MKNLINLAGRIYLGFESLLYLTCFILGGLDIDLYDYTNWDNEEWLMFGGFGGILVAVLIIIVGVAINEKKESKEEEQRKREFEIRKKQIEDYWEELENSKRNMKEVEES